MASTLEQVVRPFQSGEVFTRSRLPPIPANPTVDLPEDVHTIWKGEADTSYRDDGKQWYNDFKSDLKEDRAQRVSKLVKVTNPDDDQQKIFVERIDKTTFKDDKGKELKLTFDWSDPKDSAT